MFFFRLRSCFPFCDEKLEYLRQDSNSVIYFCGYCVNLQTDRCSSSGRYPLVSSSFNKWLVMARLNPQFVVVASCYNLKWIYLPSSLVDTLHHKYAKFTSSFYLEMLPTGHEHFCLCTSMQTLTEYSTWGEHGCGMTAHLHEIHFGYSTPKCWHAGK